jgi:hypothetical protein
MFDVWVQTLLTRQLVAEITLVGMGLDVLGGCYLAYDLLGGKRGPLRTMARAAGYTSLFFVGYTLLLGLQYGMVASLGMGFLLATEYRLAGNASGEDRERMRPPVLFGVYRGMVLGLAGVTIAGTTFGGLFGLFSAAALTTLNLLGYSPSHDYESHERPHLSKHRVVASCLRALTVGAAGVVAALLTSAGSHPLLFGLRLGLAAGTVSALVGLFSPAIEWKIENLPKTRLGLLGLGFIFTGLLLQSVQCWIVVFSVPVH